MSSNDIDEGIKMTLLKQLLAMIVLLFIMLFIGTFTFSIQNTREYLSNQLQTISQDTATSLGLSLSPHIGKRDYVMVERMVSAVSDSGYYREVIVTDVDGKTLVSKTQQVNLENVPKWFIDQFPLDTPTGEALIMDGWKQAGFVKVLVNPGYAYMALWTSTLQLSVWLAGVSLFACIIGMLALHYILKPLRTVESQARAICNREFPVQHKLPWTIELRSVVEAMNLMSNKLKEMFQEQASSIEWLRSENYRDPLTGLANRRYFEMQLKNLIEVGEPGGLLLLELKDFKTYNSERGYQAGDDLLRNTANFIEAICKSRSNQEYFSAHLSGANFAVVVSNVDKQEVIALANQLAHSLLRFKERNLVSSEDVGHVGATLFDGHLYGKVLANADLALRTAQSEGPNTMHLVESGKPTSNAVGSATDWGEFLRSVLKNNQHSMLLQPARLSTVDVHQKALHQEVLMQLTDEKGEVIPASVSIPMIKHQGLTSDFDKLMVIDVLKLLKTKSLKKTLLSVNLFPASVQNKEFVQWLCAELDKAPNEALRLMIEIPEYGVLENIDSLKELISKMNARRTKVGLDHFGRGFSSFGYLRTLKLDFIKIDGSYVQGIMDNKDNQFFISSVVNIAHSLDIQVYAVSVEGEKEWKLMGELGVDGVLGHAVGLPIKI
jgi:diguanylate cyclase (GGDEF)-like protein